MLWRSSRVRRWAEAHPGRYAAIMGICSGLLMALSWWFVTPLLDRWLTGGHDGPSVFGTVFMGLFSGVCMGVSCRRMLPEWLDWERRRAGDRERRGG